MLPLQTGSLLWDQLGGMPPRKNIKSCKKIVNDVLLVSVQPRVRSSPRHFIANLPDSLGMFLASQGKLRMRPSPFFSQRAFVLRLLLLFGLFFFSFLSDPPS